MSSFASFARKSFVVWILLLNLAALQHIGSSVMGSVTNSADHVALHNIFNAQDGATWNYGAIEKCIARNRQMSHVVTEAFIGHHWNFSRNAAGTAYLFDPCAPATNFTGVGCDCTAGLCRVSKLALPCATMPGTILPQLTALPELTYLDLMMTNLKGTIPASLQQLTKLEHLLMSKNSLSGPIPTELGLLTNLQYLDVFSNNLNGTIPDVLDNCKNVSRFDLSGNDLTGTIPSWLGNHTQITYLDLDTNRLTGTIPDSLGKLSALQFLVLQLNSLSGTLPASFKGLASVETILLFGNSISGTLPSELSLLTQVQNFLFSDNQFTGKVPVSYSRLKKLNGLYLNHNQLTGTIPHELGECGSLLNLYLNGNSLTGTIPKALGSLFSLQNIDLSENQLSGTIPVQLGYFPQVVMFAMHHNNLVGPIPTLPWEQLEAMDLSNNALTGTIPGSLSTVSGLKLLVLKGNRFVDGNFGFINPSIQTKLSTLDISSNGLKGSIPEKIFQLPALRILSAGSNCFSGSLPTNICNAFNLSTLVLTDMSSNKKCRNYFWQNSMFSDVFSGWTARHFMEGSLPECVYQLPKLEKLSAAGNAFLGKLPLTISPTLVALDVSRNSIAGTITRAVATSAALNEINLSNNRISGDLSAFKSRTAEFYAMKNMSLTLNINRLSGVIPSPLLNLRNMNILTGNLFSCDSLPAHDIDSDRFQCGSADLNVMLYAQTAFSVALCAMLLYLKYSDKTQHYRRELGAWMEMSNFRIDNIAGVSTQKNSGETAVGVPMKHIKRYAAYLTDLRAFVLKIGVLLSFVFIVYVCLGGRGHRTTEYSYAWTSTAVYLTGHTSTICVLVSSIIVMLTVWYLIWSHEAHALGSTSGSHDSRMTLKSTSTPAHSSSSSTASLAHSKASVDEPADIRGRLANTIAPILRLVIILLFSSLVIFAGNAWYVLVQIDGQTWVQNIFKPGFALFKLFWTMAVFPNVLDREWFYFGVAPKHHDAVIRRTFGSKIGLLFLMNVMTTFIIPMLSAAVVDPTCFYHVFLKSPVSDLTYVIDYCDGYYLPEWKGFGGNCAISGGYTQSLSVEEPYLYNYTCSASILRVYIPLYQQMFTILLLRSMLQFAYLCWEINKGGSWETNGWLHWTCMMAMPTRYLLHDSEKRKRKYSTEKNSMFPTALKSWLVMSLPSHLSSLLVLLTFGFLAPPLALMIILSILCDTYVAQLVLGRFLSTELGTIVEYRRINSSMHSSVVEQDIIGAMTSPARREKQAKALENARQPWGAFAVMQVVEMQCMNVPESAFTVGRSAFVIIPSVLVALVLNDVQNSLSKTGAHIYGAAIIEFSIGVLLELFSWVHKIWGIQPPSETVTPPEERLSDKLSVIELSDRPSQFVRNPIAETSRLSIALSEDMIA